MFPKIAAGLLYCLLPTALAAELTTSECAQIESVIGKTPAECQAITTRPLAPVSGAPLGEAWENHVFFPSGGSTLDAQATAKLRALGRILQGDVMGAACLQLVGHSDSSGSIAANQRLGQLRAEKVAEYLGALLSNPNRIQDLQSFGETRPLADRTTTDRWQRRVEIRARNCPSG